MGCWVSITSFIAGAITSGVRLASTVPETISSASPSANFAIVFAVAGTIAITWAHSASRMWLSPPPCGASQSAATVLSERASKVSGATKRVASGVIRTRTSAPASVSSRMHSIAL